MDFPRGIHPAPIDRFGRLQLPVPFVRFILKLGDSTVFVTSLDNRSISLYPVVIWRRVEEALTRLAKVDPKAAMDVSLVAQANGRDSSIDERGRVRLPVEVLKRLPAQTRVVYLVCFRGSIEAYDEQSLEARIEEAKKALEDNVSALEGLSNL